MPAELHLVFVQPEIHWNTGNAGRSCLAFGAQLHLVEPLGFSLDERAVRRAGLDYWARVQPRVHPTWADARAALPPGCDPWFLSTEGDAVLGEVEFEAPCAFVLGSESTGLPETLRPRARLLRIPQMEGSVRSLNLSTAAALALYDYRRQHPLSAHP